MSLHVGLVLNNRYRIVRLLGQGGFGAVYRAWDMNLNGPCAVKENFDTTPDARKQFSREASLLFNLRHPNLPKVIDQFSLPDEGQYLVMEYIDGQDLDELLKRSDGPLSEAQVLPWIVQVCDALTYLHSRTPPIIHRDIKPANVRITADGAAYLVDFGVAKTYDPEKRTTQGARAVTPGYAPFEQYGQRPTDARSDVYALGATLYHALTGVIPPESIDRMAGEPLAAPRQINPSLSAQVEAALLHALQIQPENRFKTVTDFKEALLSEVSAWQPAAAAKPPVFAAQRTSTDLTLSGVGAAPVRRSEALPGPRTVIDRRPRRQAWLLLALGSLGLLAVIAALAAGLALANGRRPSPTSTALMAAAAVTAAPSTPILLQPTVGQPAAIDPSSPSPEATSTVEPTPPATATELPSPTVSPPPAQLTDEKGVQMALVPAGEFLMGATTGDPDARPDEQPQTAIYLPDFYLDTFETTNAQFAACVQAGVCSPPDNNLWTNASYARHPVVNVGWGQAAGYCAWRRGRLPSEAEWEKAARGGLQGRLYPWGDEAPTCTAGAANGAQFLACSQGQQPGTTPVGSFAPNGYGLFDMAGNVWEWVSSLYRPYPYSADDGREDLAANQGSVTRGGSWYDEPHSLRAAQRGQYQPAFWLVNIGFRCAR